MTQHLNTCSFYIFIITIIHFINNHLVFTIGACFFKYIYFNIFIIFKIVFKWRDKYIELFLDQYRQQECLWNISSDSYKNRDTRDKAYESICSALNLSGLSVNNIKTKIKTICTNYKCELNKILKSQKSGAGLTDVFILQLF